MVGGVERAESRGPIIALGRLVLFVVPAAIAIGSAVALFLWALDRATMARWDHPWLLWLLPVGGTIVGALYHGPGRSADGGTDLITDEIHEPGGGVPARLAPLVFAGTVLTHLFGGSAGREGTAVQMGGSIASAMAQRFRLSPDDRSTLLMTGIAAGFGAVFGTPYAGAIFAVEVLRSGRRHLGAIVPCLLASLVGDVTVTLWRIQHAEYSVASLAEAGVVFLDPDMLVKLLLAGIAFGLASMVFSEGTHGVARLFRRVIPWPVARPFAGGSIVIALVLLLGTRDYLGLGVASPDPHAVTILSSFVPGGAAPWSWWWKIVFTAITLGSGFKGGEVTPLFFVGAALGNVLALVMNAPVDLFAALGFLAVFAGATKTPLACTILGVELFGSEVAAYVAVASVAAVLASGRSGIYRAKGAVSERPH